MGNQASPGTPSNALREQLNLKLEGLSSQISSKKRNLRYAQITLENTKVCQSNGLDQQTEQEMLISQIATIQSEIQNLTQLHSYLSRVVLRQNESRTLQELMKGYQQLNKREDYQMSERVPLKNSHNLESDQFPMPNQSQYHSSHISQIQEASKQYFPNYKEERKDRQEFSHKPSQQVYQNYFMKEGQTPITQEEQTVKPVNYKENSVTREQQRPQHKNICPDISEIRYPYFQSAEAHPEK